MVTVKNNSIIREEFGTGLNLTRDFYMYEEIVTAEYNKYIRENAISTKFTRLMLTKSHLQM